MPTSPPQHRVVIDTNTLLRGIISETSAAAKIRRAAENRLIVPLLSKPILDEYRAVLSRPILRVRFPALTGEKVEYLVQRIKFVGDFVRNPSARFHYPRDPLDEKFIEAAIDLGATDIVTADDDLLSLPRRRDDASKRFRQRLPQVSVLDAANFIAKHAGELGFD